MVSYDVRRTSASSIDIWIDPTQVNKYPDTFDVCHTPNHWSNGECSLQFIDNVVYF